MEVDNNSVCYFDYLPNEIIDFIFSFLGNKDWSNCQRVCFRFYRITSLKLKLERKKRIFDSIDSSPLSFISLEERNPIDLFSHKTLLIGMTETKRKMFSMSIFTDVTSSGKLVSPLETVFINSPTISNLNQKCDERKFIIVEIEPITIENISHWGNYQWIFRPALKEATMLFICCSSEYIPRMILRKCDYILLWWGFYERNRQCAWERIFSSSQLFSSFEEFDTTLKRCKKRGYLLGLDCRLGHKFGPERPKGVIKELTSSRDGTLKISSLETIKMIQSKLFLFTNPINESSLESNIDIN